MRLSLSVPDELWLRACETCPATPPSRLVQAALENLVSGAETGYAPGPPAGAEERIRRLEGRLREEARAAYQDGYETGLDLADVLEWWVLEAAGRRGLAPGEPRPLGRRRPRPRRAAAPAGGARRARRQRPGRGAGGRGSPATCGARRPSRGASWRPSATARWRHPCCPRREAQRLRARRAVGTGAGSVPRRSAVPGGPDGPAPAGGALGTPLRAAAELAGRGGPAPAPRAGVRAAPARVRGGLRRRPGVRRVPRLARPGAPGGRRLAGGRHRPGGGRAPRQPGHRAGMRDALRDAWLAVVQAQQA